MDVTVITSTIGRAELRQALESVASQTHPCFHFVFINGPKYHESARGILKDFPSAIAFYLPEETGDCGAGPSMSTVFAAAPWMVMTDYVFFLNDDDYYDSNHVESLVKLMKENKLDWSYALRRFVDSAGPICDDDFDSLGHWPCVYNSRDYLVDNSCYALRTEIARKYGAAWLHPTTADRNFLHVLKDAKTLYGCTGLVTVNYRVGTGSAERNHDYYHMNNKIMREHYNGILPWRRPCVFTPKKEESE